MYFTHDNYPGYKPGKPVPVRHIRTVLCAPTAAFWKTCLKHIKRMRQDKNHEEAARVMTMAIYGHCKYHLGMEHYNIGDCAGATGQDIAEKLDQLLQTHNTILLFQIDFLILRNESFEFCYHPQSDGLAQQEDERRFHPED